MTKAQPKTFILTVHGFRIRQHSQEAHLRDLGATAETRQGTLYVLFPTRDDR